MYLITEKGDIFPEKDNCLNEVNNNSMISRLETKHKSDEEKEEKIQKKKEKKPMKKEKEKILILEIITSNMEKEGKKIIINPEGYNLGLRHAKDGLTIFGYEDQNKRSKEVRNKIYFKF